MATQARWLMLALAGVVAGIVLDRLLQAVISPPAALAPGPASPADVPATAYDPDRVPGNGTLTPPKGYPIKGNERSGIYHVPGGLAYDRTIATVHFRSEEAAERAGFRHAKM